MLTKNECLIAAARAERYPPGFGWYYLAGKRGVTAFSAAIALKDDPSLLVQG